MKASQRQSNDDLYDQVIMVMITFKSMETKELLQHHLFRSDAAMPTQLRQYYSNRKREVEAASIEKRMKESLLDLQKKAKTSNKVEKTDEETHSQKQAPRLNEKDIFGSKQPAPGVSAPGTSNLLTVPKIASGEELRKQLTSRLANRYQKELERIHGELRMSSAVDPEYIIWENIGISRTSRRMRVAFSYMVASLLICLSLYLVSEFQRIAQMIKNNPRLTLKCK